jgi:hypothetical protein
MRRAAAVLLLLAVGSGSSPAQQSPGLVVAPRASTGGTSAPPADPFKDGGRPESRGGTMQQPAGTAAAGLPLSPDARQAVETLSRHALTAQQYGNLASKRHTTGAMHDLGDRMVLTNSRINKALSAVACHLPSAELMSPAERSTFDAVARNANETEFGVSVAQWISENYPRSIAALEQAEQTPALREAAAANLPELRAQLAEAQRILQAAGALQGSAPTSTGTVRFPAAQTRSD